MAHQYETEPTCGILIVAHGERGGRKNNARLLDLASEVRSKLSGVQVETGVLKGDPSIADGWQRLKSDQRYIYPFFMSDGFFCNKILPKKVAEAIGDREHPFTMLPPFGISALLAESIARAISNEMARIGRADEHPPLLIAAHGASIDRQSSLRTHELADSLRKTGLFGPIRCGFLDEDPHVRDMIEHVSPNTILLPHFNGLGSHSVDDMAQLKTRAPEDCHFMVPVGGQDWVGAVMAADIASALKAAH